MSTGADANIRRASPTQPLTLPRSLAVTKPLETPPEGLPGEVPAYVSDASSLLDPNASEIGLETLPSWSMPAQASASDDVLPDWSQTATVSATASDVLPDWSSPASEGQQPDVLPDWSSPVSSPVSSTGVGATAPPDGGDAGSRATLLAKIDAHLDAAGQAQLAQLDANGVLDKPATDGKTVLQSLAAMAGTPLADAATKLGFTPDSVLAQTVGDLADPKNIQQTGDDDCVWTNLRFHMAQDKPGDYVEMAAQLYQTGKASIGGGGTIALSNALNSFSLKGVGSLYYQDGHLMVQEKHGAPMAIDDAVTEFLNNPASEASLFEHNPDFDNPATRAMYALGKQMWNAGEHDQVAALLAPLMQAYLEINPSKVTGGLEYALHNYRNLFQPASQSTAALPEGIPLNKVASYYQGLTGYKYDDAAKLQIGKAVTAGAEVPVVFRTDDGLGLHLETVIGTADDGNFIVYDPESGPRELSDDVFKNQAVAAFMPTGTPGVTAIDPDDASPVGGGRVGSRGGRG